MSDRGPTAGDGIEQRPGLVTGVLTSQGEFEGGAQQTHRRAAVVTCSFKLVGVYVLLLQQQQKGVGQLNLTLGARRSPIQALENVWGQNVPPDDRKVGRSFFLGRFLHQSTHLVQAVSRRFGVHYPVVVDHVPGCTLYSDYASSGALLHVQHLCNHAGVVGNDVVRENNDERFAAHRILRGQHGVPQAKRLLLNDKRHLSQDDT